MEKMRTVKKEELPKTDFYFWLGADGESLLPMTPSGFLEQVKVEETLEKERREGHGS